MTTTTKPERIIAPTITETPEGIILASYEGPRVSARGLRVAFMGRTDAKGYHDSERGNVTELHHVCRVRLTDADNASACTINGIALDGYAACVYRRRWVGKDASGDSILEAGWDYDYSQGYVRRKGGGWSDPIPDGARAVLYALTEAIVKASVTPERLRLAECERLKAAAMSEREAADELEASAKAKRANAAKLYRLASLADSSEGWSQQSEIEREIARAKR